ncbi:MAG TPA: hypothetical protein VFA67_01135 [Candidatus Sulfotelmatobacter sp.]|nr:hypothetical protein [Candidatus Sulfotelmatobacter sp.]
MRTIKCLPCVLVLWTLGCGGNQREALMKESVAAMDEMATALEQAKTAAEAKPKLVATLNKLRELKKRDDALGPPSKAVSDSLKKKFDPEMTKITERVKNGMAQLVKNDPKGLKSILPIFEEMGQWDKK